MIPILSDDAGISMREFPLEEIVALILEHFSMRWLWKIVLSPLMDERQRVSRRDLDRFMGAGYSRHVEASSTIIKYPSLDCSYALILHGLCREENCVPASSVGSSDPISSLVGVEI